MTIVEPLSALFMTMVSSSMSLFRACLCLCVRLSLGFIGVCNAASASSFMSSTMFMTSVLMLWWDGLPLVGIVCLGVSSGIISGWCDLFLWLVGGFVCRVLFMSVLSLSKLHIISLGLVFFGLGIKDNPVLRTSFSVVVRFLLVRLIIASVVFGC